MLCPRFPFFERERGGLGIGIGRRLRVFRNGIRNAKFIPKWNTKIAKGTRELWAHLLLFIYYLYLYTTTTTCHPLRCLTFIYISHAFLYAEIPCDFLAVMNSKAQNMPKKRHSKKPLHFCNIKNLFKIKDLQKIPCAFFSKSILGITFQQQIYNPVTIMYTKSI